MTGASPIGDRAVVNGAASVSAVPASVPSAVNGLGDGRSNDWHTPRRIFDALAVRFDLDVSAPIDGPIHVPCSRWISSGSLEREWSGFIWMNAPFGGRNGLVPWLDKFFDHGNGVALTPDRTSAPWFSEAWARADAVLLTKGKTPFLLACGSKAGTPAFGTALWAVGRKAVDALMNAEKAGLGMLAFPKARTRVQSDHDLALRVARRLYPSPEDVAYRWGAQEGFKEAQAMSAGTAKTEGLGGDSPASAVRQDAPETSTQTHTTKKKGE